MFNGDADEASQAILDRSLLMGLDVLCDGRRASVNCTRDTLIKSLVTLPPSATTVVGILESVPADPDVVPACQSLKEAGYLIALDHSVAGDKRAPLAELADIVTVDMKLTTGQQRLELIKQHGPREPAPGSGGSRRLRLAGTAVGAGSLLRGITENP